MNFSGESLEQPVDKIEDHLVDPDKIIDIELDQESKKFETPLVVVQGWGRNGPDFKKNSLDVLASQGRRVLAFESPREIKTEAKDTTADLPLAELQKAEAILDVLDQKGITQTDAIGYSEGGISLAIAAHLKPERFRNLVFVEPAGMIGKDSLLSLVYRFGIKEGSQSKLPGSKTEVTKALINYIRENPSLCLQEIKAISQADIYEMLKELKSAGLNISFVFGVNDKVFPMERVQETYHEKKETGAINDFRDILDGFYSIKGTHGEFLGHGEKLDPQVFPRAVGEVLSALDKKSVKSQ